MPPGEHVHISTEGVLPAKETSPCNVTIGTGPGGTFLRLSTLAQRGYRPLLFGAGAIDVDNRSKKVEHFWETGELDEKTNVSFGEGGAVHFQMEG
ncbi:MAG: hypothetical protein ACLTRS_05865 [Lachnospiraceae bacterium]